MKKIALISLILLSFLSCEKEDPVILSQGETEQFSYSLTTLGSLLKTGRSLPLTLTITSRNPELFSECELLGNSEFDILDTGELKSTSAKEDTRFSMVTNIVYLEPGEYSLPSYLVTGTEGPLVLTPDGKITIESSLIEEEQDFADIDPPVKLPGPGTFGWLLITGIPVLSALLLFLVYMIFKKRRKKKNIPLDVYCLAELEKLKKSLPIAEGSKGNQFLKNFYFKLTEIIRYFYDGIFKANTLEKTLEEYLPHVTVNPWIKQEEKRQLIKMLTMADKIKFASFKPQNNETEGHLNFCMDFIKSQAHRLQEQKEGKE